MKKAQLEIMQSAFIIMIVLFLLAIAIIFIAIQQKASNTKKMDQFLAISQIKKSKIIALLPETQYSVNNAHLADFYDKIALYGFRDIVEENPLYYKTLLGDVKLVVSEYDYVNGWTDTTIIDYSKQEFKTKKVFHNPVILVEPDTYNKRLGVIRIEVYN